MADLNLENGNQTTTKKQDPSRPVVIALVDSKGTKCTQFPDFYCPADNSCRTPQQGLSTILNCAMLQESDSPQF